MKIVPMYFARLPDPLRPGRMFKSRHRMTLESIQRQGGIPIESTVELREVATTREEQRLPTSPRWGGR